MYNFALALANLLPLKYVVIRQERFATIPRRVRRVASANGKFWQRPAVKSTPKSLTAAAGLPSKFSERLGDALDGNGLRSDNARLVLHKFEANFPQSVA